MDNLGRLRLISQVASELQDRFTTNQINVFLAGFGIPNSGEQIVPSKRVHVENKLSSKSKSTILKIAKELDIPTEIEIDTKHEIIALKRSITKSLESKDFYDIDLILDEYDTPRHNHYDFESAKEYILFRIKESPATDLYSINEFLNQRASVGDHTDVWGDCDLRVFISHLSTEKRKAKDLAKELAKYNATGFVAHIDIKPNDDWLNTIESALSSMDIMLALVTEGFKDSDWAVQEVGFALGKGVPVIAIRNGMDPFGFFGKWQAIQGSGRYPKEIIEDFVSIATKKHGLKVKQTSA